MFSKLSVSDLMHVVKRLTILITLEILREQEPFLSHNIFNLVRKFSIPSISPPCSTPHTHNDYVLIISFCGRWFESSLLRIPKYHISKKDYWHYKHDGNINDMHTEIKILQKWRKLLFIITRSTFLLLTIDFVDTILS